MSRKKKLAEAQLRQAVKLNAAMGIEPTKSEVVFGAVKYRDARAAKKIVRKQQQPVLQAAPVVYQQPAPVVYRTAPCAAGSDHGALVRWCDAAVRRRSLVVERTAVDANWPLGRLTRLVQRARPYSSLAASSELQPLQDVPAFRRPGYPALPRRAPARPRVPLDGPPRPRRPGPKFAEVVVAGVPDLDGSSRLLLLLVAEVQTVRPAGRAAGPLLPTGASRISRPVP